MTPKFKLLQKVDYSFFNPERPYELPKMLSGTSGCISYPNNETVTGFIHNIEITENLYYDTDDNTTGSYKKIRYTIVVPDDDRDFTDILEQYLK